MIRQVAMLTMAVMLYVPSVVAKEGIESVHPDLVTPSATDHAPAPGKRVRQINKNYAGTKVYHLLYLPTDWKDGEKYPVIIEYAGNRWKTAQELSKAAISVTASQEAKASYGSVCLL